MIREDLRDGQVVFRGGRAAIYRDGAVHYRRIGADGVVRNGGSGTWTEPYQPPNTAMQQLQSAYITLAEVIQMMEQDLTKAKADRSALFRTIQLLSEDEPDEVRPMRAPTSDGPADSSASTSVEKGDA